MLFCETVDQVYGLGLVNAVILRKECRHLVWNIQFLRPKPHSMICLIVVVRKEDGWNIISKAP